MNRPCPKCNAHDWGHVTIRDRRRAVCVACFSAWWVEGGKLVGISQSLFSDEVDEQVAD